MDRTVGRKTAAQLTKGKRLPKTQAFSVVGFSFARCSCLAGVLAGGGCLHVVMFDSEFVVGAIVNVYCRAIACRLIFK